MSDQVYDVFLKAKNCQIKSAGTREIVVQLVIKKSNVYILKEKIERCCFSNIDET